MSNGIAGLRGYRQGDLVEDSPGWWERLRERARQGQRESTRPRLTGGSSPIFPGSGMKLPLAFRQIMADVLGKQVRERLGMEGLGNLIGSRDITAGDMSQAEYSALQDAVIRSMGGELSGGSSLEYEDYATAREGEDAYSDVGGSGGSGILTKFLDPSFSVKSTFGQARIRKDPETGDYYMTDQYNFNERLPESTEFGDFLEILKTRSAEQGPYGVPRAFGQAYGSPEGEGSMVRINLGDLQEALARSREPESPRGLAWLRNLFGRDRDEPQVAGGPPNIPEAPPSLSLDLSERQASGLPDRPSDIPLPGLEFPR